MDVIRATAMGMCFGVRDALAIAAGLAQPQDTTIFGELVHNETVQQDLARRGFLQLGEVDRDTRVPTQGVMITAHGVSDRVREALIDQGHTVTDTTCPLVVRAHDAAKALAAERRHVIVLGRRDHVEVRGLVGDLPSWSVVERLEDVTALEHARIGIVCQTTLPEVDARRLRDAIRAANPHADIAYRNTVCEPTRQRQRAVRDLAARVDAMVVVGGRKSNNTAQLVRACAEAGRPVMHVQGPEDVPIAALAGYRVVGLTAGTSTLDATIDAVEAVLRRIPVPAAT